MASVSRYWQFVCIDAAARVRIEEVAAAKAFFQQQFPELIRHAEISDSDIQRRLWELRQGSKTPDAVTEAMETPGVLAEYCLRCFISHQILESCKGIESKFGQTHKFNRDELLPLVLDDNYPVHRRPNTTSMYRSLATKILESFDPDRSSLATWVNRLVRRHSELNRFLVEHGVHQISDWAILNDTSPHQLQRTLTDYLPRSEPERQRACALLEAFHIVYQHDRLQQRQSVRGSPCRPPTNEQLQKMATHLEAQAALDLSPERVMQELQSLARLLRNYRILLRGGNVAVTLSVTERQDDESVINNIADDRSTTDEEETQPQEQFLTRYRYMFIQSLDQAIAKVIGYRVSQLRLKKTTRDQDYLKALYLFYCRGQSMSEIARAIGLQAQYQVSRLLNLKELRANIRQELLKILSERVLEEARQFVEPERFNALSPSIETVLAEQLAEMFLQAEAEVMASGDRPVNSSFSVRMRHYLEETRN